MKPFKNMLWVTILYTTIVYLARNVNSQCSQHVGCFDCLPTCVSFATPDSCTQDLIRRFCRKTCGECASENEVCQQQQCAQRCVKSADGKSATCACFAGYRLAEDGRSCNDIDECEENPNICKGRGHNVLCQNSRGNYTCAICRNNQNQFFPYYNRQECCKQKAVNYFHCGASATNGGRVVGGRNALVANWPWTAYILTSANELCGGTLIDQNWILTAAHCVVHDAHQPHRIRVVLGVLNTTGGGNVHEQTIGVNQTFIYDGYQRVDRHDIALLRLNRKATIGLLVGTVCLPNGEEPKVNETCYASGYGVTSYRGKPARFLQEVDLPIVDGPVCEAVYQDKTTKANSSIHICAGHVKGGKDTCQGDSGGPLVCQRCNNCDWYIAGITSFGQECARPGVYGVYTRVTYYEQWIANITAKPITQNNCVKPAWSSWGTWTDCSATCGRGDRSRLRMCLHGVAGKDPGCVGPDFETTSCNNFSCSMASWSDYTAGVCSVTCGGGNRTDTRMCLNGNPGDPGCVGATNRIEACNDHPCPSWSDFGQWSACTRTCGGGIQTSKRSCNNGKPGDNGCQGKDSRQRNCNTQNCPRWSDFKMRGECSVTCGEGTQIYYRECIGGSVGDVGCMGVSQETRGCSGATCPDTRWSNYTTGICSVTCNGGIRTATRTCLNGNPGDPGCVGATNRTEVCNDHPCPIWGMWNAWGACTVTCGSGTRRASRMCITGIPGASCNGNSARMEACNEQACPSWSGFGQWSACTRTCGGGIQTSKRSCNNGKPGDNGCQGKDSRQRNCNTQNCPRWSDFKMRGECSVTCGEGTQIYYRECIGGSVGDVGCMGVSQETRGCSGATCPVFSSWSTYGACSVTCNGGKRERTRECPQPGMCPSDEFGTSTRQTQNCNEQKCPGRWSSWENVGNCSVTCGNGSQTQMRRCIGGNVGNPNCEGLVTQTLPCVQPSCPNWGQWSEYSDCSVTCGGGSRQRRRNCTGVGNCIGMNQESITCNQGICSTDPCAGKSNVRELNLCTQYANSDFCRIYRDFMKANCDLACCKKQNSAFVCEDRLGSPFCAVVIANVNFGGCIGVYRSSCLRTCRLC